VDTDDLVAAFGRAAATHRDRPAVVSGRGTLTYGELEALARETAQRLGTAPGTVGVLARHDADTVVALLGVWLAGGTYCPIDPAFPASRRDSLLAAAGCRRLLDSLQITDLQASGARDRLQIPDPQVTAYVLFTSGSTGEPKGVLTPHQAISAAVGSLRDLFEITPEDRVLQFASLNWDTCFEEILPALTTGATLVFHPDAHSGSFRRFLRMLESEQISVIDLPTAYWHELVNHMVEEGAPLPECVRLVIIGGEAANPARIADWCGPYTKHARLLNTYGCTETTLVTHAIELDGSDRSGARSPTSWSESPTRASCSSAARPWRSAISASPRIGSVTGSSTPRIG